MTGVLQRLLRVGKSELPKLVQFGLFGFLLQVGIGFSAGHAAFFSNLGAADSAADTLSLAVAARLFLNKPLLKSEDEKWLRLARKAFNTETLKYKAWHTDEAPEPGLPILALSDPETSRKAVRFSKAAPDATAEDVLDGVGTLLKPTGVFAAMCRTSAAQQAQYL